MNIKSVFIVILLSFNIYAQQDSTQKITIGYLTSTVYDDAKLAFGNIFSFYASPADFSSTDWLIAAGIVGTTYGLMHVDGNVYSHFSKPDASVVNSTGYKFLTEYGVITYGNLFGAATYTTGLFLRNDYIKTTGRLLLEGLFISGFTSITLRTFFGRARPNYENDPWKFNWFVLGTEVTSFPSGHTTVATALSTVLAERIDNNWARVGFYGLAALNTAARIYSSEHWLSDTLLGSLIGFGAGWYVVHRENERVKGETESSRVSIYPSLNGISISVKLD